MKRKTRLIRPRAAKTPAEIERIGALEARIADLEGRIARLEKAPVGPGLGWPGGSWPERKTPEPEKIDPCGGVTCPKCRIIWKGAMGYVCPDPCCPMGAGGTWCGSQTTRIVPVTTTTTAAFGGHKTDT